IMCVGGFENSKIKQAWYNHAGIFQQCWGTPYNTGDGIDICSAAGAAMWHLEGCEWSACAYRLPSEEVGCAVSMPEKGYDPYTTTYFWVNKYGARFMNEQTTMNHNIGKTPLTDWTHNKGKYPKADEYPNLPFWMVFDQNMYDKVQLYQGTGYWGLLDTYCAVQGLQPAEDWNNYALDKGWIVKADTIEELAAKMQGLNSSDEVETCDAEGLKATFDAYNAACKKGKDVDFERPADSMQALSEEGPYYAIEMCCSSINTQGGPWHDGYNRTLDAQGNVIPRLYNCGEFGSINGFAYLIGNICEALTTGRIAALDCAALDPQA
ncbi:MAG: FAD-binding protein, partial [Coriobacteriaceae bacterium]|nr:FAD-binding protein [Coriobacteriaceae bacterium]